MGDQACRLLRAGVVRVPEIKLCQEFNYICCPGCCRFIHHTEVSALNCKQPASACLPGRPCEQPGLLQCATWTKLHPGATKGTPNADPIRRSLRRKLRQTLTLAGSDKDKTPKVLPA